MYLLLHRALRNAGDYLILERAKQLFHAVHPAAEIDVADGSRPLSAQFSRRKLSRYRAVVIAGGPGFAPGFADRYPLGDLRALPPVVFLAGGTFVMPGTTLQLTALALRGRDRRLLDVIASRAPHLGARDPITANVLSRWGYRNVKMVGDPAWYDLTRIDEEMRSTDELSWIVFTPPANPLYRRQAARLLDALQSARPTARITIAEHRGLQPTFARLARERGLELVDISGSASGLSLYDQADLHVGYRVHAHLYCLSRGRPSYLAAEDSRGAGVLTAFPGTGDLGFENTGSGAGQQFVMKVLSRLDRLSHGSTDRMAVGLGTFFRVAALDGLPTLIARHHSEGFPSHSAARDRIRGTLPIMRGAIERIQ